MYEHHIQVHSLPKEVDEAALAGCTTIVIDVLRASTTICQALASGAREVVPFPEVDDALAAVAAADRSEIVLAGERHGRRIDGFDLGNSPSEFTPPAVAGRRVFITTTNGTQALYRARLARQVLIGAFVNLSALAWSISKKQKVDVLCAGTDGRPTREDILAAGALVDWLDKPSGIRWEMNSAAKIAHQEWQAVVAKSQSKCRSISQQLAIDLRRTPGGRNLLAIRMDADLVDCAQVDRLDVVPELDVREWRITPRCTRKPPRWTQADERR